MCCTRPSKSKAPRAAVVPCPHGVFGCGAWGCSGCEWKRGAVGRVSGVGEGVRGRGRGCCCIGSRRFRVGDVPSFQMCPPGLCFLDVETHSVRQGQGLWAWNHLARNLPMGSSSNAPSRPNRPSTHGCTCFRCIDRESTGFGSKRRTCERWLSPFGPEEVASHRLCVMLSVGERTAVERLLSTGDACDTEERGRMAEWLGASLQWTQAGSGPCSLGIDCIGPRAFGQAVWVAVEQALASSRSLRRLP